MELPDELVAYILCFLDICDFKAILVSSRRLCAIMMSNYMKNFIKTTDYRSKLTKTIHEKIIEGNISVVYHLLIKGETFLKELEERIVVDPLFDEGVVTNDKIVKIRISQDVFLDEPDRPNHLFTSLFYAIRKRDLNMLKLLLKCGADPNRRDDTNSPLLHHLLDIDEFKKKSDFFGELLKHGANPEFKNGDGFNAVEYAIVNNIPVYRGLINHSQNIRFDILYDTTLRDLARKNQVKQDDESISSYEYDEYGHLKVYNSESFPTLGTYMKRLTERSQHLVTEWMGVLSKTKNFTLTEGHGKFLKKTQKVLQLVRMGIPNEMKGIIYPLFFPIDMYRKKYKGLYLSMLKQSKAKEGYCIDITIPRITYMVEIFKDQYSAQQGRLFRVSMAYGEYDKERIGCVGCCGMMEFAMILLSHIDDEETVFLKKGSHQSTNWCDSRLLIW